MSNFIASQSFTLLRQLFTRHKQNLLYGISMALLLVLLKWLELRFTIISHANEVYTGAIALIFMGLGIWLALKLAKPKVETVVVEKEILVKDTGDFVLDENKLQELGISRRELEVLELIAMGHSNQEIANRLFVSLNTVKTHTSKLFEKLDAKRRTQAIEKGKRLGILP